MKYKMRIRIFPILWLLLLLLIDLLSIAHASFVTLPSLRNIKKINDNNNHQQQPQQLQFSFSLLFKLFALQPIDPKGWPDKFPAKEHCSKCGLCETTFVSQVKDACAFLDNGMSNIHNLEEKVHGRSRLFVDNNNNNNSQKDLSMNVVADECRFGVFHNHEPVVLAKGVNMPNAQWTGLVTSIAVSMLESKQVDAVVCIANAQENNDKKHSSSSSSSSSWSTPEPIIAKTVQDVLRGRGVKPALAPSLRVLDEIQKDSSIRKLLFCGVGCAVQALRAVQDSLNLDELYVMGTNCVDNSPTPQAAQDFIEKGVQIINTTSNDEILGYEFMQDFKVHVKTKQSYITKPYFTLPGTIAESSIATSCLSCFDYTNALADVVVGYMGAPLNSMNQRMDESFQTLTIRNEKGAKMIQTAMDANRIEIGSIANGNTKSHESYAIATTVSDSIVKSIIGESDTIPQKGMPMWLGEVMAFAMTNLGPKGIQFAKYSIDYHLLRNYLHVVKEYGKEKAVQKIPQYAIDIIQGYLDKHEAIKTLESKALSQREKELIK